MFTIATFYRFADFADFKDWQQPLISQMQKSDVKGTILLAAEGLNATIAGPDVGVKRIMAFIRADERFAAMEHKLSYDAEMPFQRIKVKLRREIVTLQAAANPAQKSGHYVKPQDWNALIVSDDVVVIDTRNDYEVEAGTFQGALNPKTAIFSEFPKFVSEQLAGQKTKKIAMFCTGGIRCEKASAYMLEQGFAEVYQLEGGILKYLEQVPPDQSLWRGECFIFDDRRALNHGLQSRKKTVA